MDKYLDNNKPINIKGTIFICNELCNLTFDYLDQRGMTLSNLKNKLYIDYTSQSSIKYNGGEAFGSQASKYLVKQIMILAPPIHTLQDVSYKMELIITHEATDGNRFQHMCILLEPSDAEIHRKSAGWKLFEKFANQLPALNQSGKNVDNVIAWNATDFLPNVSDRSFYTYNMDPKNNFIVFQNPTYTPTSFYTNLIKKVIIQQNYNKLLDIKIPPAPPADVVIFAKKNIIEDAETVISSVQEKCIAQAQAQLGGGSNSTKTNTTERYVSNPNSPDSPSYDEINYGKAPNSPSSSGNDNSTGSNAGNESGSSNNQVPKGGQCPPKEEWGWWTPLIIVGVLVLAVIAYFIYNRFPWEPIVASVAVAETTPTETSLSWSEKFSNTFSNLGRSFGQPSNSPLPTEENENVQLRRPTAPSTPTSPPIVPPSTVPPSTVPPSTVPPSTVPPSIVPPTEAPTEAPKEAPNTPSPTITTSPLIIPTSPPSPPPTTPRSTEYQPILGEANEPNVTSNYGNEDKPFAIPPVPETLPSSPTKIGKTNNTGSNNTGSNNKPSIERKNVTGQMKTYRTELPRPVPETPAPEKTVPLATSIPAQQSTDVALKKAQEQAQAGIEEQKKISQRLANIEGAKKRANNKLKKNAETKIEQLHRTNTEFKLLTRNNKPQVQNELKRLKGIKRKTPNERAYRLALQKLAK